MKIFLGTEEVASVLSGLNEGFLELGYSTTTYVAHRNSFYSSKYDIVKGRLLDNLFNYGTRKWPRLAKKIFYRTDHLLTPLWVDLQTKNLIDGHDLFVFIWRPWIHESKLFKELKKKGKKIICVHLGSDVRDPDTFQQEFKVDVSSWQVGEHGDLNYKINKIRQHELYADVIYSVPDQAGLSVRPYKHIYLPLSKKKNISVSIPAREHPIIIHAPTNVSLKGSDIIIQALDQLKSEGLQFEVKLIKNMPNDLLLAELTNADILVDELILHGPGVLSMEAMAAGCAVATKTIEKYQNVFDPPVCSINSGNIVERLRKMIMDVGYRIELAEKGLEFVKKFNSPAFIAGQMIEDIKSYAPDYYPKFFIESYLRPDGVVINSNNKQLTKQVLYKSNHFSKEAISNAIRRGLVEDFTLEDHFPLKKVVGS